MPKESPTMHTDLAHVGRFFLFGPAAFPES